ncbi:hypothetical protein B7Z28_01285, partial [Candidatus Saccharibacteria bacterium 32-45-3]
MHRIWRQFRPRLSERLKLRRSRRDNAVPQGNIYDQAWRNAQVVLARTSGKKRFDSQDLDDAKKLARDVAYRSQHAYDWLTSLILQAPTAAQAQNQMDKHKHGYRNREARLYELIDFNDTYVSTVLAFPADELANFNEKVKQLLDACSKQMHMAAFTDMQWEAIT